jgi:DnaJ homolog subfamily C member 19
MSTEEALEVLGLPPKPSAQQVFEAHHRLEQQLDPDHGGTSYLMSKINEARDVLL